MGVQADQCRIMVRVYANILGLSKILARAGMVGHEARSLSPFTSAFNRAQDLFDFVDAAEKKEGSDFKIRGKLRIQQNIVFILFISIVNNSQIPLRNVPAFHGSQPMSSHLFCGLP